VDRGENGNMNASDRQMWDRGNANLKAASAPDLMQGSAGFGNASAADMSQWNTQTMAAASSHWESQLRAAPESDEYKAGVAGVAKARAVLGDTRLRNAINPEARTAMEAFLRTNGAVLPPEPPPAGR
jgi:hypothetical protein